MAFVRKVRTKSGATAVQVARYVGSRQEIVKHIGSAHTDVELGMLLERARAWLEPDPSCTRLVCQPGPGIRDAEGVEDVRGVVGERIEGGVLVAGDRDGDFLQGTQGPHDLPDRHPGRVLQIA